MLKECVLLKKAQINITHALHLFGKNILTFEYHIHLSVECINEFSLLTIFHFKLFAAIMIPLMLFF